MAARSLCSRLLPSQGSLLSASRVPSSLRPRAASSARQHTTQEAAHGQQPPRFYVPTPLQGAAPGTLLRLSSEEARHAAKTLRLKEGDRLELCDGRGFVVLAELAAVDRGGAAVTSLQAPVQISLSGWQWEVACACGSLKGGRSDWLVEKCAELGAAAFTPLLTERSPAIGGGGEEGRAHSSKRARRQRGGDGADDDAAAAEPGGREGRWARVNTAAMKQCLRAHAMQLSPPQSVQQLCERIRQADAALVGVGGAPPVAQVAAQALAARGPAEAAAGGAVVHGVLCIGPEGDWTEQELAALVAAGARPVGLGELRLRAETAAVALLSYVRMAAPSAVG